MLDSLKERLNNGFLCVKVRIEESNVRVVRSNFYTGVCIVLFDFQFQILNSNVVCWLWVQRIDWEVPIFQEY